MHVHYAMQPTHVCPSCQAAAAILQTATFPVRACLLLEMVCSCSGDTKLLVTLTGEPDWTVLLWRWQQAKVLQVVLFVCSLQATACCCRLDSSGCSGADYCRNM